MKRIYKFKTYECYDGHRSHKFVEEGTPAVLCDTCGEPAVLPSVAIAVATAIAGDEVDYVDHNLGRDPIRIRSKAERRRLMKEQGLVEFIRHTPVPGTDKSPYTSDWSKGSIDAYTLESARVLVSRQGGERHFTPDPDSMDSVPLPSNAFSYRATPAEVRELVDAMKGDSGE